MTAFKRAVEATPAPVNGVWRPKLQALQQAHRGKVHCADISRLTGSIDLDAALRPTRRYANASRWDYGIGYQPQTGAERAIWIEVHQAVTSEVSAVLKKRDSLRDWLAGEAEALRKMTDRGNATERYFWVATGKVNIPPNSRQARLLSKSGIRLVPEVSLD